MQNILLVSCLSIDFKVKGIGKCYTYSTIEMQQYTRRQPRLSDIEVCEDVWFI